MFTCDRCGECCRHLNLSPLYAELDRGDGVCRYLQGNLCSIYDERPVLCRVDECYTRYFQPYLSLEEYYRRNKEICRRFQKEKLEKL